MSKPLVLHSAVDAIAEIPGVGIVLAAGSTVPSDNTDGFAPGCLFIQSDGATEATIWYANIGTRANCDFDAVDLNIAEAALLTGLTATAAEINAAADVSTQGLTTGAGAGITGGTGTVYKSSVLEVGGIITTNILIDLTGLHSENVDLDIIGVDGSASVAHIGQITAAQNGTILGGTMRCLEVPTGGDPNVALYAATEGTGVEDGAIGDLAEAIIFDPNADWTIDMSRSITGIPAADKYLYLVQGDATGTDADYTAGKFLITFYGYDA